MNSIMNDYTSRFGVLWIILSLTGIDVFEDSDRSSGPLTLIRKWCFPALLFANFCHLLGLPFTGETIGYISFVDAFLPFFPVFLWLLIYKRRNALKDLMNHLNSIALEDTYLPRYFTWAINASFVISFLMAPVLIAMSLLCREPEYISREVQFRYLHEIIFPPTITILYCGICYIFIRYLETLKTRFDSTAQFSDPESVQALVKSYLSIVKALDIFRDLFSTPVFLILCQEFGIITVYVLDILETDKRAMESMMVEMVTYTVYTLILIGILTVMAAEIPIKLHRIKKTIMNKMSLEAQRDEEAGNDKQLSLLLKRDVSALSACNIFPLNRAFLLKALGALVAQIVVFYQMGYYKQGRQT